MNTQVYYHRLRRIYDLYLKEYFKAKGNAEFDTAEKVLRHNDMTMFSTIIQDADKIGESQQPWAKRIRDRQHHRLVYGLRIRRRCWCGSDHEGEKRFR
jgi:hypothetical protein